MSTQTTQNNEPYVYLDIKRSDYSFFIGLFSVLNLSAVLLITFLLSLVQYHSYVWIYLFGVACIGVQFFLTTELFKFINTLENRPKELHFLASKSFSIENILTHANRKSLTDVIKLYFSKFINILSNLYLVSWILCFVFVFVISLIK